MKSDESESERLLWRPRSGVKAKFGVDGVLVIDGWQTSMLPRDNGAKDLLQGPQVKSQATHKCIHQGLRHCKGRSKSAVV